MAALAHLLRREAGFIRYLPSGFHVLRDEVCLGSIQHSARVLDKAAPHRAFHRSRLYQSEAATSVAKKDEAVTEPENKDAKDETSASEFVNYRERYIPVTRKSIIRHIIEEKDLLTEDEKKKFEDFAISLDTAIVNKYHGILQELKYLFDPINPDKDTIATRKWTRRERLDNEFWLLQRLEDIMEKANFHQLSRGTLDKAMQEHDTTEGVRVKVDPDEFDILKLWALGREHPRKETPWYMFWKKATVDTNAPEYFKRVIVAIRLKKDQKLVIKSFKEVPTNSLEMLLPTGKIMMKQRDKMMLGASGLVAFSSIVAKTVTYMAKINLDSVLLVTLVTGLLGIRVWTSYTNRRNKYLVELNRMLYFKSVANNRGLLALIVDRAEDESFKEAILTYAYLLSKRPESARKQDTGYYQMVLTELGGATQEELNQWAEDWVHAKTGSKILFDSSEALTVLKNFAILNVKNDKLTVMPLEAAMRNLPEQPPSVIARANEIDLAEGYDRDEFLETEEEYKKEEQKSKRYGWF